MSLDVRTLFILMGVICSLVSGAFLFFQAHEFRRDGVREWSAGHALQGAYWVLLGLRGIVPDFLSILMANAFLTGSYSLLYAAVRQFQHRPYRRGFFFLPTIATVLVISFFWVYQNNIFMRTIYISLMSGIQMGAVAWALFRGLPFHLGRSQWLTGSSFIAGALIWFTRFSQWILSPYQQTASLGPSVLLTALLILGFGTVFLTSVGFLLMIRERAGKELLDSGRRLMDIVDSFPDATVVIDRDGEILFWNREMENLTGVNRRDMLGKGNHEYSVPFYGERQPVLVDFAMEQEKDPGSGYDLYQRRGDILSAVIYLPHLREGGSIFPPRQPPSITRWEASSAR